MPDPFTVSGSILAGAMVAAAIVIAARGEGPIRASILATGRLRSALARALQLSNARDWLDAQLERAGWNETPERAAVLAAALAACLGVLGAGSASLMPSSAAAILALIGCVGGVTVPLLALRSAVASRRARLSGELVPLLELLSLELSGGGSALSALGSVCMQVQGELATDLRRMLIASQVAGSASVEARLVDYSERLEIPQIGSLATILASSREYGTGVVQGVRALATDLRHGQRRELIAHSRRALNHVLLPAAVGVLLPFLAVLMFPAVSALQRNLR